MFNFGKAKLNAGGSVALSGNRAFEVTRGNKNGGDGGGEQPKDLRLRDVIREALPTTTDAEVNVYRIRNFFNIMRGFWRIVFARAFGISHRYGAVYARSFAAGVRRCSAW